MDESQACLKELTYNIVQGTNVDVLKWAHLVIVEWNGFDNTGDVVLLHACMSSNKC